MTAPTPMLSSGTLTLLTFLVLALFITWGVTSLRKHASHISAPHESELTEQGRQAEDFEHHFVEHREVPQEPHQR